MLEDIFGVTVTGEANVWTEKWMESKALFLTPKGRREEVQFWGLIFALRNSCSGNGWSRVSRTETSRHFPLSSVYLFVFSHAPFVNNMFSFLFCLCVMGRGINMCMHRCRGVWWGGEYTPVCTDVEVCDEVGGVHMCMFRCGVVWWGGEYTCVCTNVELYDEVGSTHVYAQMWRSEGNS